MTQRESSPAWSAVFAISASVLPSLAGPASQVKFEIEMPSFIAVSLRYLTRGEIMAVPMKPVLCIRNDRADNLGITAGALAANGREMVRLDAFDSQASWPSLDEVAALIVFGGEMNVDEVDEHPYLMRERELMLHAVASGYPVLGICLGAQLLARAGRHGVPGAGSGAGFHARPAHRCRRGGSGARCVRRKSMRLPVARGHLRAPDRRRPAGDRSVDREPGVQLRIACLGRAVSLRSGPRRHRGLAFGIRRIPEAGLGENGGGGAGGSLAASRR